MSNIDFKTHQKCEFAWYIQRVNNRRVLKLYDKNCGCNNQTLIVLSKERLKNLFDKKRISNLLYLEGLGILQDLRKRRKND